MPPLMVSGVQAMVEEASCGILPGSASAAPPVAAARAAAIIAARCVARVAADFSAKSANIGSPIGTSAANVARIERQRNPGLAVCADRSVPAFAPLEPGYGSGAY